jgi:multiple sugar transport system substrate-binding protein
MFKRSLTTLVLLGVLTLTGAGCGSTPAPAAAPVSNQPVTLQYWGVFTDSDDMSGLIAAFTKKHPNIQVQYRKFRPEEYEQKLLEAFAEDRGPDLFTIHSTWLQRYKSKLSPLPPKITFTVFTKEGSGFSEKTVSTPSEAPGLSLKQLRDQFVQTVERDVLATASATSSAKAIFALPFSVDSLAMYYNKDLLAQNAIVKPAANWNELRDHAEKLTRRLKDSDVISQPAVAMGTAKNVHRAGDLLIALMQQNGAVISDPNGNITFNGPGKIAPAKDEAFPAARALQFYLDFANPATKAYSWNEDQGDALEAFADGKLAYYFGYSYDLASIRSRNPRLNFDVAALPQFDKPTNIANYWMESVANKSKRKNEAWLFIQETSTNKEALTKFLKTTKRAAALTDLIQTQLEDLDLGVFAKQNLTADTWYRGKDSATADLIMTDLIDSTRLKLLNPTDAKMDEAQVVQEAIDRAAKRLNDTI